MSLKQIRVTDMGDMTIPAPAWMNLPIEEQIEHQVKETLCKHPNMKVMMCFTYDKNRVPQIQRQVVEV